ncbi:50S ribosomal protein L5 [Candidatus Woesearchaeota archaeon]|nr:50S ribosomal protein L5 [Candidatus Woesearchaeota archaeon]
MNPMQTVRIEKVTLNVGAGKDQAKLEKGVQIIKQITGIDPVKTITKKRIPAWGLRPGLPIGCKVTLRKQAAQELLGRLLHAKDHALQESQFDQAGNISFGIPEYIDIKGSKYDPKIGIMGLQVCVTLEKPGFRVKKRSLRKSGIGKQQLITKEEAKLFMQKHFQVKIGEQP